jgi:hypothetical protein
MTHRRDPKVVNPVVLRRLRAAGCPLPTDDEQAQMADVTIEISRPELTRCYALRAGAEYVFGIRITNHSYGSLQLQRFAGCVDWHARLLWPIDPRIQMTDTKVYRLESGRKFPCADVLNHRVSERGIIEAGESMEGILLAYSMLHRVPKYYLHDSLVPAQLSVIDQYGRRHVSVIEILIDRTASIRPGTLIQPSRKGLFDASESTASSVVSKGSFAPHTDPKESEESLS